MLEKINEHYSFTAPATIFNEEALTTLELAARTAAKVNECVQAFNALDEETKNDIHNQHLLLNEIDLLVQKFLPYHYAEDQYDQCGAFAMLTEVMHTFVDAGKFAEIYDIYADNIRELLSVESKRIDNIIGGATPASDSEIIDLRIDCEGNEWESAGSAVRNMTRSLLNRLSDFTKPNTETVEPKDEYEGAIWQNDGELRAGFGHHKTYAVTEGEKYLVSAYYGYKIPDVIFSDGNPKPDGTDGLHVIGVGHMSDGVMSKNRFDKPVIVPAGATEMYVQWADSEASITMIEAKRVSGYRVEFKELTDFINTALEPIDSLHPNYVECNSIETQPIAGSVIQKRDNGSIVRVPVADGSTAFKTRDYIVKPGQRIKFTACANFGNLLYYMYNSLTDEIHSFVQSSTGSSKKQGTYEFLVPLGVNHICVANITNNPVCSYMKTVTGLSPFEGKTAYVIGDSVSEFNSKAEKNYLNYLEEKTGLTIVNGANSGAGFLNERSTNTHYFGQVLNLPATCPDVVIVMGSGNDLKYVVNDMGNVRGNNTNTLYGQMYQVFQMINSKYAGKAKIVYISPVPWKNYTPNIEENVMHRYANAMAYFCQTYSIPFLDLYHKGGLNPFISQHLANYYDTEGVHPNDAGHKIIASPIYNFLLGVLGMEGA